MPAPRLPAGRLKRLLPGALIGLVVAALYARTLGYGFFGDTFVLVLAARVESFADLVGIFTDQFMEDYNGGSFYRPVASLTLALDHALWGLAPAGFQLTQLVLFAACAAALFAAARALLSFGDSGEERGDARVATAAALAGTLVFALDPGQWEGVAFGSRRSEHLCVLFTSLALVAHLRLAAAPSGRRAVLAGLWVALAAGSKESGALALPLSVLALACAPVGAARGARAGRTLRLALPALVGTALYAAGRWIALGEVVGHTPERSLEPALLLEILGGAWLPDPRDTGPLDALWPAAGSVALVVVVLLARRAPERTPGSARTAALGLAWIAGYALLVLLRGHGHLRTYYRVVFLAGLALVLAAGVAAGVDAWRARRGAGRRALVAACALPLLALVALQVADVSRGAAPSTLRAATDLQRRFLESLTERIAAAAPGEAVLVERIPYRLPDGDDEPRIIASVLASPTLAAWIHLRFPGRRIVVAGELQTDLRIPDAVVVALPVGRVGNFGAKHAVGKALAALGERCAEARELWLRLKKSRGRVDGLAAGSRPLLEVLRGCGVDDPDTWLDVCDYYEFLGLPALGLQALEEAERVAPGDPRVRERLRVRRTSD